MDCKGGDLTLGECLGHCCCGPGTRHGGLDWGDRWGSEKRLDWSYSSKLLMTRLADGLDMGVRKREKLKVIPKILAQISEFRVHPKE